MIILLFNIFDKLLDNDKKKKNDDNFEIRFFSRFRFFAIISMKQNDETFEKMKQMNLLNETFENMKQMNTNETFL